MHNPKDWMKAGGLLGGLVMLSRLTRTPLATLLSMAPVVLEQFKRLEKEQSIRNSASMSREEACLILGVDTKASSEQITEAYRRLMHKNHPDQGGTDYLASKINQARDTLLGKK